MTGSGLLSGRLLNVSGVCHGLPGDGSESG